MAINRTKNNDGLSLNLDPNSTKFDVLLMLYDHDEYAFRPSEIGEKIGENRKTVQKTLSRLVDDGLVGKMDDVEGHYHALDDEDIDSEIRSHLTVEEIEEKMKQRNQFDSS